MAQTARYCMDCLRNLSPATAKTAEDKAMLAANQFTPGSHPIGKGPQTEDGQCIKCGKKTVVTFYESSN